MKVKFRRQKIGCLFYGRIINPLLIYQLERKLVLIFFKIPQILSNSSQFSQSFYLRQLGKLSVKFIFSSLGFSKLLNTPSIRYDTQLSLLVIFVTKRTTLCFITLCSTYDKQTFYSVNLNGIPVVSYSKMAFSKQHALTTDYVCFRAMISFDKTCSFCYVFYLLFFCGTVVRCKCLFLVFVVSMKSFMYILSD